ncbi:MAG: hypothetical protein IPJ19_03475 [Planctomycetes bacterium]|nr:hypothetical protein [Planctomycetota bacterium]
MLACLLSLLLAHAPAPAPTDPQRVHGMTISCQTWGWEWGSDGFGGELDALAKLGVNWVAIHPYARIGADGSIESRALEGEEAPGWITRPIAEAHARGMSILVIPHVAYWGSPWSWRGAIQFDKPQDRERFFRTYGDFLEKVAHAAHEADGFSIGNELDRLIEFDGDWRAIIARVRQQTHAKLTYASNWSDYQRVPFWDALDAIGVEAYFPLCDKPDPCAEELAAAWLPRLAELRALHERTGKPVVFTEIGYTLSLDAAKQPWADARVRGPERDKARALQERCLAAALAAIEPEHEWLRGAFLWKWFVGSGRGESFHMDTPRLREVIAQAWAKR